MLAAKLSMHSAVFSALQVVNVGKQEHAVSNEPGVELQVGGSSA